MSQMERTPAEQHADELLQKLKWNLSWLRAALDCKTWDWDWDQREVAEQDYAEGMALVAKAEGRT